MPRIQDMSPRTGRLVKENNNTTNLADKIDAIYDALVTNKNAGVEILGSKIVETQDQDDAAGNELTFAENIIGVEIHHSEASAQNFVINGLTIKVVPGGWRSLIGGIPSKKVIIPAGVNCVVARLI